MTYQNKTIKVILTGGIAILLMITMSFGLQAQDRTAATAYNEGLAKLKEKDFVSGLTLMEEALTLAGDEDEKVIKLANKNGSVAAYNIGNTKRKAGELDDALTYFEKGIEMNPEYASNHFGKALVLDKKEMKIEALTTLLTAANKYRASGKTKRADKLENKAQNDVGRAYTGKEYELAVTLGKAYLESHKSSDVHYYISRSLIEQGNNEDALTHADMAISEAATDLESETKDKYFIAKGLALENLSRNTEAIEAYKMVSAGKYKEQADYKIQKLGSK